MKVKSKQPESMWLFAQWIFKGNAKGS